MNRLRFFTLACCLLLVVLLASFGILAFEYIYGNGDGIWMDLDVVAVTYKTTVVLAALTLLTYGLLYGAGLAKGIISTVLLTGLLLFGLEKASLWLVNRNQPVAEPAAPRHEPFLRPDHTESSVMNDTLGVKAKPNWQLTWVPLKDGVAYDTVAFSTDSLGRRITPLPDSLAPSSYALFLGCSYTYGDGVSNRQTLPYYFQTKTPGYRAYNYGFLAYSPLHMLARLQQGGLRREVPQSKGFAVFTLINDHLDRVIPATRWVEMTQGRFPYLDEKTMTTGGVFADRRRMYTDFLLDFQNSGIKQLLKWSYPRTHTEAHYQLLVNIIKKSQQAYEAQFGNPNFYVVVFPGNPLAPETKRMLEEARVPYFDYSGLMTIEDKMLPFDSAHPTGEVYEAVATQLSRDIKSVNAGQKPRTFHG